MSTRVRYVILSVVVIVIVAAIAYVGSRGGGEREQGLVGPGAPPAR